MSREVHVRFWERLGVRFPRATRQKETSGGSVRMSALPPTADVNGHGAGLPLLSSHAEGFHLRVLPEPYVNLSAHTAPDVRPFP